LGIKSQVSAKTQESGRKAYLTEGSPIKGEVKRKNTPLLSKKHLIFDDINSLPRSGNVVLFRNRYFLQIG